MLSDPRIAHSPLRTRYGDFTLYVFSWSDNEQDNVLALLSDKKVERPLVRVQSACYTGEIFESVDCDCHWQLETSLKRIQSEGGVFVYMLQDGRGAGLLAKVRGMALSAAEGVDTADAYRRLGVAPDPRDYEQAAFILKHLGITAVRLLTNNPRKIAGLATQGIEVERARLESEPTEENRGYLKSKALKLGHMMRTFGTDSMP
ncbi:GTP cyclohydrolase II [Bradyrhizobium sp. BR 10261]|uniref:GTP cyclohydrolase II n=1 Tax=Bradyrhizobium sp. BR 10261 TaxID=2749992 RepID=UPI001C649302|nr:GTP cyclohydrolase II [Bradyrhizobium sp. BR 10261]MBW7964138.1 GTP cyclohydrolase II [Bradyrhizobium sp. BR 10261]